MPEFIASGSHNFNDRKYRFLILPRYKCDLHSIIKDRRVDTKNLLIIACQILDILEHIHDNGYAHSDIKAENLMIGTCTYRQKKQSQSSLSTDSGRDSNDDNTDDEENADEAVDSMDDSDYELDSGYKTPVTTNRQERKLQVEFSGSNPVRSCRMERKYSIYQDMLSSHYLRPSRKVNYYEDEDDDYIKNHRKQDADADWFRESHIGFNSRRSELNDDNDTVDNGETVTEDRIFLIDYGLALKFINSAGVHHPFVMDQRRAHDGTIEFTSRDAHMGAHSRRSDLECLGFNLIYWCEGTLPWKDEKLMIQPEQVHRMKEYFMADVEAVYKSIYGQSAPKFICDFLHYVGGLAYHDRPDYGHCRRIFIDDLKKLCDGDLPAMRVDLDDLKKNPLRKFKNGMENNNVKLKDVKEMMKLHQKEPFKENGLLNRISPKNLRSKSEKIPKKQQKKFSWTDVLSTDPDQIARQRAEKEIERDMTDTPITSRYEGKPTYAILAVQNRTKFKEKLLETKDDADRAIDDFRIDGYTPAMMDVLRKRQSVLLASAATDASITTPATQYDPVKPEKKFPTSKYQQYSCSQPAPSTNGTKLKRANSRRKILNRRKSCLRNNVRQTQKCVSFCTQKVGKKRRNGNSEFTPTEESSCGSAVSFEYSSNVVDRPAADLVAAASRVIPQRNRRRYHSNTDLMLSPSDEDSRDTTDYTPEQKPTKKTPQKNKVLKKCLPCGKGE